MVNLKLIPAKLSFGKNEVYKNYFSIILSLFNKYPPKLIVSHY